MLLLTRFTLPEALPFFGASTALLGSLIAGMATSEMGQTRKSGDAITTSALPPTADIPESVFNVRKVPCVDGSGLARAFFTVLQHWSVQPCVRPFDAVHMTAGHNALRGSGPDQHLAFKNALAHVGCPDRRIDRLCITCCLPS